MYTVIRIGSRESALAVKQAKIIKEMIEKEAPGIRAEIITMKTTGDKILDKSLEKIGGKGLFVKELDRALAEGRIDLAVHSLKDMPMEEREDLPILAYSRREDPRDVLLLRKGLEDLPEAPVIGTSSRRRSLQMEALYPKCTFRGIRGNVQTRMYKLETEGYDGTLLAAAGLKRLGMEKEIRRYFSVEEMIPAAGQGILAVQGRQEETYDWIARLDCPESRAVAQAERQFIRTVDGGCTSPCAAHARVEGNELKLSGLYYDEKTGRYVKGSLCADTDHAAHAGEKLAQELMRRV
ncbi:MAG: hydroxymethylbilane synthase [Lachnospiraceae bacterium]|nr:hydroxymethylbilane synthase [Lachnospiraceae bacterium]